MATTKKLKQVNRFMQIVYNKSLNFLRDLLVTVFDRSLFHVDTTIKQNRQAQVLLLGRLCRSRQPLPLVIESRGNAPKSAAKQFTSLWTHR